MDALLFDVDLLLLLVVLEGILLVRLLILIHFLQGCI